VSIGLFPEGAGRDKEDQHSDHEEKDQAGDRYACDGKAFSAYGALRLFDFAKSDDPENEPGDLSEQQERN
jgi:hypothetical protein